MDLRSMLVAAAEREPGRVAVADGRVRLTYLEWVERVFALANALAERGVSHGDRVAVGMRNSVDHATVFFALQSLGAVATPFNFRLKPAGVAYVLEDADAAAVVVDHGSLRAEIERAYAPGAAVPWIAAAGAAEGVEPLEALVTGGSPTIPAAPVQHDDLSMILYTSGTTGRPKGVPLTHRNGHARITSYLTSAGPFFGSELRTLGAAPLYHTVGLHWVLCLTVYLNGTYVAVPEFTGASLIDLVERERLTFLFGSPTLFHIMIESLESAAADTSSVTDVSFGSAPMPPALLRAMGEWFPNATINEVYGTTEIAVPFVMRDAPGVRTGALRVTADHRVRVVVPGGGPDVVAGVGETGELIVDMANDGCFSSYWNKPGKTAERVRGGWYFTGDAFVRFEDGTFAITGRLDDMFISGGENIQPVEIEQVLSAHPGIVDVAVIGTPDPRWGEVVTALVVRADVAVDEVEIDRFCRESDLDDFKRPRRVVFVDAIERNPSGKLVRKELRDRYATAEPKGAPELPARDADGSLGALA